MTRPSVAMVVTLLSLPASADVTKQQCIDADTQAQAMRAAGKLSAAREQLQICGDAKCPGMVRDDCSQRLDEIDRVQPTVVFAVKDGDGRDLAQVHVTLDGAPLTDTLSGTALRVDPGRHTFAFRVPGEPIVTRTFVIEEGQKDRREVVVMGTPSVHREDTHALGGLGPVQIAGLSVGAAGVVGVALGTVFGVLAGSAWNSAKATCGGNPLACTDPGGAMPDRSTALAEAGVSTAAFIAGGLLIAAGAFMLLAGHRAERHARPILAVGPTGLFVMGSF